jgi:hypothetical protein
MRRLATPPTAVTGIVAAGTVATAASIAKAAKGIVATAAIIAKAVRGIATTAATAVGGTVAAVVNSC